MGRQIVQDDDFTRPKSRSQLSLDAGFKNAPVRRRVNDEGAVRASHRRPAMKVCDYADHLLLSLFSPDSPPAERR
jgi:hypothetical protein